MAKFTETRKYTCRDGTNLLIEADVEDEDCVLYIKEDSSYIKYNEMTVHTEKYGFYIRAYAYICPNKQKINLSLHADPEFTREHLDKFNELSGHQKYKILKKIIDPLWEGVDFTGANSEEIEDEAVDEIRNIILRELENMDTCNVVEQIYKVSDLLWIDATIKRLENFLQINYGALPDTIIDIKRHEAYLLSPLVSRFDKIRETIPEFKDRCIIPNCSPVQSLKHKVKYALDELVALEEKLDLFSNKTIDKIIAVKRLGKTIKD